MRKVRENVLVTSGDQSVFPNDRPVFVAPAGSAPTLNGVMNGQLVFYNHYTGISVGAADIVNLDRPVMAVGVDTTGDGHANVLRKAFGESLFRGAINAATAEPPRCGVEKIVDLFYKCVHCDESFGINITVEDDTTQNQYPYNRPSTYTFSVNTGCCECDTCDTGIDENKLSCLLVDQINNNVGLTDARHQSVFVKLAQRQPELPFYAVKLHGGHARASLDYCFTPIAGACSTCPTLDGIKEATFTHPVDGAVTVDFTGYYDASNDTPIALLDRIIADLNTALGEFGSAVKTATLEGTGRACCPYQIQINTCITDFQLVDQATDSDITPCSESDPFAPIAQPQDCVDCDNPTVAAYTPTAGIRIIAKPVEIDCNCDFPPDTPRGYLGRDIKVQPIAGFACGSTTVTTVQEQILPENLGYEWKWREYTSDGGGTGRGHNPWGYDPHGVFGLPLKGNNRRGAGNGGSRAYSTQSVCKETYCTYVLEHNIPKSDIGVHGNRHASRGRTVVLIPSGDSVTRTEFEAILNAWIANQANVHLQAITCASDQDQTETTLDGVNVETPEYPNHGGGAIL